jgi:hypothetical protein
MPLETQVDRQLSPIILRLLQLRHSPAIQRDRVDEVLIAMLKFQCKGRPVPDLGQYDELLSRSPSSLICTYADVGIGPHLIYDTASHHWFPENGASTARP